MEFAPRPEGAMLAVRADGLVVGSVSGGCIEDDLIDHVRRKGIEQGHPEAIGWWDRLGRRFSRISCCHAAAVTRALPVVIYGDGFHQCIDEPLRIRRKRSQLPRY